MLRQQLQATTEEAAAPGITEGADREQDPGFEPSTSAGPDQELRQPLPAGEQEQGAAARVSADADEQLSQGTSAAAPQACDARLGQQSENEDRNEGGNEMGVRAAACLGSTQGDSQQQQTGEFDSPGPCTAEQVTL